MMNQIVYPVCKRCRDYERTGFAAVINIGMRLAEKLSYILTHRYIFESVGFLFDGPMKLDNHFTQLVFWILHDLDMMMP